MVNDDETLLCGRCQTDVADPDEHLPGRFIYLGAVCALCSRKLTALDHQLADHEYHRWLT